MRVLLSIIAILLSFEVSSEGMSEEEIAKMKEEYSSVPINTFRFLGNQIMCKMEKADDDYACLRIGPLKINSKYEPKSEPWKEIPQPNGVTASVFPIVANDEYEAYWVVGHKDGVIISLQLTGDYPDDRLNFATIKLADSEEKVKRILGPRYQESDVQDINGKIWDYVPFPISVEFKNGVVYSIRISK